MWFLQVARRAGCLSALTLSGPGSPDLQQHRTAQLSIGSRLWQAAQSSLLDEPAAYRLKVLSSDSDTLLDAANHEILDVDLDSETGDDDRGYDSDDSMLVLEDSGYASDDELLSVCASFRSSLPEAEFEKEGLSLLWTDEEMLCT